MDELLGLTEEEFGAIYLSATKTVDRNHPVEPGNGYAVFELLNTGYKRMCADTEFMKNFHLNKG
ncbi:hypothetical protein FACS1894200_12510 [Spirochaetia bacterium]|nr:hypothetical protein FACS1894200_12510 [Spirochaetia bacterium]